MRPRQGDPGGRAVRDGAPAVAAPSRPPPFADRRGRLRWGTCRPRCASPASTTCRSPSSRPATAPSGSPTAPPAQDELDERRRDRCRPPPCGRRRRRARSDVIAGAAPHGLAPLSGTSPTVGVTGYTLGGAPAGCAPARLRGRQRGARRARDRRGRADNVSPSEHPDLFWALRGGSGNFGVVTALEFRLFPVAGVYAGAAMFDAEARRGCHVRLPRVGARRARRVEHRGRGGRAPAGAATPRGRARQARADAARLLRRYRGGGRAPAGAPVRGGRRAAAQRHARDSYADAAAMLPPPPPTIAELRFDLFREVPDVGDRRGGRGPAWPPCPPSSCGTGAARWRARARTPAPSATATSPSRSSSAASPTRPEEAERLIAGVRAVAAKLAAARYRPLVPELPRRSLRRPPVATRVDDYRRLRAVKAVE